MADYDFQALREEWSALVDAFLATDMGLKLMLEIEPFERPMVTEMLKAFPDMLLPTVEQDGASALEAWRPQFEERCSGERNRILQNVLLALTEMYRATVRSENDAKTRVVWLQATVARASLQIQEGKKATLAVEQPLERDENRMFHTTDQVAAFFSHFEEGEAPVVIDEGKQTVRVPVDIPEALAAASVVPTPMVEVPPTVAPQVSEDLGRRLGSGDGVSMQDLLAAYCNEAGQPTFDQPMDVHVSRYHASPPPAMVEEVAPAVPPTIVTPHPPSPTFSEEVPEVTTGETEIDPSLVDQLENDEIDEAIEGLRGSGPHSKDGSS